VSISANPGNTICTGTNVVFTATPTNGGTPSYQWKLNGNNVGINSNTYSNAALINGDQVSVVMTSSLACANPTTATSNTITMTVTATVVPSVSIAANPGNTICTGTNVVFTATPTNGGTPSYQWKLNGNNVGTNSNTYSNAALINGDQVSVVMTSSLACASPTTATSNTITMTVTATVVPSASIAANPGNTICTGTNVVFTATPTNGGTPSYQWKLNGNNVGTNSNTYSNAALVNGDQVSVVMTSSLACASPTTATSNTITMTVTATVVPSASIAVNPGNTICTGTNVVFTATPTNGGTPSYQWKLNGNNVGTNSNTYSNAALVNGDQVSVVMTSSLACASPTTATSNTITMTVTATVVPSVSIAANPGNTICTGTNVVFTATPTNGGTPSYQWKLNGNNVGTNSNTYSNAALVNGDQVSVVMTFITGLCKSNYCNFEYNYNDRNCNSSSIRKHCSQPG
jgi:UDP-N-acetyl-D-mannosaminuronic acid transferase (WecB/TagA/CpsF family)